MKRELMTNLVKWKASEYRKPLIVQGARQVGKTWLLKTFGKEHYQQTIYINFESNLQLKNIFEVDFDLNRIQAIIEIASGQKINADTLIIFDEIQEAEKGLTALKYFCELAPELHIAAAGSFLGIALQKERTFPVGKVDFLTLYPLSFAEFLANTNEQLLLDALYSKQWQIVAPYHEKLVQLLRLYYFIGGMPEVVQHYISTQDFSRVRQLQEAILVGYQHDFAKYAPVELVPKLNLVWNNLLSQLAKENRKFVYSQLKQGARAKEFEAAINWLTHAGLLLKCHRISKPVIPLKAYADYDAFKLYCLDVGLLSAMGGLSEHVLLEKNRVLTEFKGALTEQFVAQHLIINHQLFYWTAEAGQAEVDFIIQNDAATIPIEVKAEENLKAKSLAVYIQKFAPPQAFRFSMSPYRKDDLLSNLPLYAIITS